jgi:membrane protease YdiL (CAAX protease family)
MTNFGRASTSRLTEIPPLTAGNLALALFALPLFSLLGRTLVEVAPVGELIIQWCIAGAVVGIAVGIEEQSLADIGFRRPTWLDLGYTVVTATAALLVFALTDPVVATLGLPMTAGAGTMAAGVGIGGALAGAVTTGVVEEVLFRGYAIERLLEYTNSPPVAGGLAWGAFTIAHATVWPVGNLVQIAAVAGVFTGVYLRRRTLFPVIGAHVLVWAVAVLGQFYG